MEILSVILEINTNLKIFSGIRSNKLFHNIIYSNKVNGKNI